MKTNNVTTIALLTALFVVGSSIASRGQQNIQPNISIASPCILTIGLQGQINNKYGDPQSIIIKLALKNVSHDTLIIFTGEMTDEDNIEISIYSHSHWIPLKHIPASKIDDVFKLKSDNSNIRYQLSPGQTWSGSITISKYDLTKSGLYKIIATVNIRRIVSKIDPNIKEIPVRSSNALTIERDANGFHVIKQPEKSR